LRTVDANIITENNVYNCDIPNLLDPCGYPGEAAKEEGMILSLFPQWDRIRNARTKMRDTMVVGSSAYSIYDAQMWKPRSKAASFFDMFPYMHRSHKLSFVHVVHRCARRIPGSAKSKMCIIAIIVSFPILQNGSDEDRQRLAVYCLRVTGAFPCPF
jgi:DNA polymerase delta subunit 1